MRTTQKQFASDNTDESSSNQETVDSGGGDITESEHDTISAFNVDLNVGNDGSLRFEARYSTTFVIDDLIGKSGGAFVLFGVFLSIPLVILVVYGIISVWQGLTLVLAPFTLGSALLGLATHPEYIPFIRNR